MTYDILQLNDMLLPELQDLADQQKLADIKKLNKQDLIYKILDSQAVNMKENPTGNSEKPKRKSIVKATTANSTEEAEVMSEAEPEENN